ncbi:PTS sorbitol transporter subunit IIB [Rubrobacter marinus]|uniref:PTS sorbitol transporter subunit IIB n=1 Tax=Rubrobacter marinus TaxID=2653852 RepID=A0A6G8PWF5_9ACTN|nr:PTS glucitol/sorbitol transporter subunit IIB [Rubrobacter marinus]QIN78544.1 PTS sorbitol transporter subunit IIB [Rubrobacter marinus]
MQERVFRAVKVERGPQGWGGPLVIQPTAEKDKIVAVTGGGIPEVARRLAELTGAEAVDGFRAPPPESEIAAVVVDCGGTARAGVYPRKRIPTINLTPVGQSGPLAQFIKEDIYVSGVREANITPADGETTAAASNGGQGAAANPFVSSTTDRGPAAGSEAAADSDQVRAGGFTGFIARFGRGIGGVVGILFQSGRQSIDTVIRNVLPFIAFVTLLIGIINASGLGNLIANTLSPLAGNLVGLLVLSVIVGLPFLSPVLGPGAVIAQVIGVLIGDQIARGAIDPSFALPALFAYNVQVGCDFVPVGLALGEAKPKTIEIGVPAVLFSRQITGPLAVIIAFLFSFGLYQ